MFCHLHTHSYYSFLEGMASPEQLAGAAAAAGMPALALTDHLSLTGALPFYRACRAAGVKPILGLKVDLQLPYRLSSEPAPSITGSLVLLAMEYSGWKNLCRISSILLTRQTGAPPIATFDLLAPFREGLICLTGGCRGTAQRLLAQPDGEQIARHLLTSLNELYPQRLYIELNDQAQCAGSTLDDAIHVGDGNQRLLYLAASLALPTVAAHSIYYLEPDHESIQRVVASIRTIIPLDRLPSDAAAPPGAFFRSASEMDSSFAFCPEALSAAAEIAGRCSLELDFTTRRYPVASLKENQTAIDVLRQKAEAGARRLYGEVPPPAARRLEDELTVINTRGYAPIFLIAEEMVSFAHKSGIPTASRGSASSSLVAHCIGITTPDPLELDLYFERFLNPARATPPDIDTDFCSRRREEVIQHLFETYGQDRVAMIGTINTFRPRSALSEVAKAHGMKPQEIRILVSGLHHHYFHPGAEDSLQPYAELIARYGSSPRHAILFEEAAALLGLPHHLSVHAGGVVIAPEPIVDCVPVSRSGGKGVTITQFGLDDVERMGLVKLDLLGIRGLTVLGDVADGIYSWRRKEFHAPLDVLEAVPAGDPETAALISSARTIGCFQIESPGMRATLKDIHACSISDLMAALALFRPGPLKGGLRDAFVRRHNHLEPVSHIHPALTEILSETYGVILYQEQVLRIANGLAGFSLADADLLRRAMSHFDPGRQMLALQKRFIEAASARSAVPPETGARIWDMMAAFAGYGFPKAHAASYAQVAWRSAWCKAHYPAEFIAAVLANWGGYYPQSVYLNEARRSGLPIRPPHINHARMQFSVAYPDGSPKLFMGLDQVRELTHRTQARILRYRPFHSLADFIARVDPRPQEARNLIQVGALDGFGAIPDLLRELATGRPRPGQLSLFSISETSADDWTVEEKVASQLRLLGVSLEIHPLEMIATRIIAAGAISTVEAAAKVGEKVRVVAMRQSSHRSLTSKKEWMSFLTIEDLDGMLDVVLFPDAFRRSKSALSGDPVPLLVEGTVDRDGATGEPLLHAEKVTRFD